MQGILSAIANAANKTGVNVLPSAYALYDSAALPSMTITGATASLDSSTVQFGNASLKLVATAATVSVSFTGFPVPITPFQRWIVSVFAQSSRSAITGTLAVVTPETSYPVNIDGNLLAGTWGRLYGDCSLTSDDSSGCTVTLTLTGCSVGDVYHFDGWQLEQANGTTDLPSAFVCSGAPASQDALPDGSTYVRLDGSHAAGNVAYNYRGVWAAGTAYVTGDETVYAGTYWLATAGSTGSAPGSSGAPWQAVGAYNDYTGAWSATTAYLPGQEVTYAGNFWVCALANSNSAPAVGNANWAMAGPQSLQNIADGTSRFAVVNAGGLNAVASVDTNQRALIDFSQSAHLYRSQDYIPDGTSYGRAPLTYGTSQALTIPNADFSAPLDPQGNIPGLLPTSSASLLPVSAGQPPYTKNCLLISAAGASGSFGGANGQEKIPCASGDYLSGSIMIWPDNATVAGAGYSFYDGAGTALGAVDVNATAGTSWQLYNFGGIAPANTAYASRTYYVESTGSATYAGFSTMRATLNDLRVAGSGTQIGDQRNLLPITFGGVRSVLSASPITYTITPGSPTSGLVFSVAAVSLYAGSVTINYAASSASHTQTNGTSANWFLYYVDPTMSGGSLPLQATANPNGPA